MRGNIGVGREPPHPGPKGREGVGYKQRQGGSQDWEKTGDGEGEQEAFPAERQHVQRP